MKDTYCCQYHPDVFIPTKFHRCDLCVDEVLMKYGIRVELSKTAEFLDEGDIISSEELIEVDPLYQEPK